MLLVPMTKEVSLLPCAADHWAVSDSLLSSQWPASLCLELYRGQGTAADIGLQWIGHESNLRDYLIGISLLSGVSKCTTSIGSAAVPSACCACCTCEPNTRHLSNCSTFHTVLRCRWFTVGLEYT